MGNAQSYNAEESGEFGFTQTMKRARISNDDAETNDLTYLDEAHMVVERGRQPVGNVTDCAFGNNDQRPRKRYKLNHDDDHDHNFDDDDIGNDNDDAIGRDAHNTPEDGIGSTQLKMCGLIHEQDDHCDRDGQMLREVTQDVVSWKTHDGAEHSKERGFQKYLVKLEHQEQQNTFPETEEQWQQCMPEQNPTYEQRASGQDAVDDGTQAFREGCSSVVARPKAQSNVDKQKLELKQEDEYECVHLHEHKQAHEHEQEQEHKHEHEQEQEQKQEQKQNFEQQKQKYEQEQEQKQKYEGEDLRTVQLGPTHAAIQESLMSQEQPATKNQNLREHSLLEQISREHQALSEQCTQELFFQGPNSHEQYSSQQYNVREQYHTTKDPDTTADQAHDTIWDLTAGSNADTSQKDPFLDSEQLAEAQIIRIDSQSDSANTETRWILIKQEKQDEVEVKVRSQDDAEPTGTCVSESEARDAIDMVNVISHKESSAALEEWPVAEVGSETTRSVNQECTPFAQFEVNRIKLDDTPGLVAEEKEKDTVAGGMLKTENSGCTLDRDDKVLIVLPDDLDEAKDSDQHDAGRKSSSNKREYKNSNSNNSNNSSSSNNNNNNNINSSSDYSSTCKSRKQEDDDDDLQLLYSIPSTSPFAKTTTRRNCTSTKRQGRKHDINSSNGKHKAIIILDSIEADNADATSRQDRQQRVRQVMDETRTVLPAVLRTMAGFNAFYTEHVTGAIMPTLKMSARPGRARTAIRVVRSEAVDVAVSLFDPDRYCGRNAAAGNSRVVIVNMTTYSSSLSLSSSSSSSCSSGGRWLIGGGGGGDTRRKEEEGEALWCRSSLALALSPDKSNDDDESLCPFNEVNKGQACVCVYTPDVVVIRASASVGYELLHGLGRIRGGGSNNNHTNNYKGRAVVLPIPEAYRISVISVAVARPVIALGTRPGGRDKFRRGEDRRLTKYRMRLAVRTALARGHGTLVLGGVGEPAGEMARCWLEVLRESEFRGGWFDRVVFAVPDVRGGGSFGDFEAVLSGKMV